MTNTNTINLNRLNNRGPRNEDHPVISLITDSKVRVFEVAGLYCGHSKLRQPGEESIARYGQVAYTLSEMLTKNGRIQMNAVASTDGQQVYTEITLDGKLYSAMVNKDKIRYSKEALPDNFGVIPYIAFAYMDVPEFADVVDQIIARHKETGACNQFSDNGETKNLMAEVSDAFTHCHLCRNHTVEVDDNDSTMLVEAQKGFEQGAFEEMNFIATIENTPAFSCVKYTKVVKKEEEKMDGLNEFKTKAMSGAYHIPFNWDVDARANIPHGYLETAVFTNEMCDMVQTIYKQSLNIIERMNRGETDIAAIGPDVSNWFLYGPPGTGKTTMAYLAGEILHVPVYTVSLNGYSEEDVFQGKNKIAKGTIESVATPFLSAFKSGGIVVIEEVNFARPDLPQGVLGQATEFPYVLEEFGYNTIRRHPLCCIVCTSNLNAEGTRAMNPAFKTRLYDKIEVLPMDRELFIQMLMNRTGQPKKVVDWVYDAYERVRQYLEAEVGDERLLELVSTRGCIGALRKIGYGSDKMYALRCCLANNLAGEGDGHLDHEIYENVLKSLRPLR